MVIIREATAADVPQVKAHITETLAEFGLVFGVGSDTDAQIDGLPGTYGGGGFWLATERGELLGTAGVFPLDAQTVELRKMYLHSRARGRGIGKRLLEVAITHARARGAKKMVLDTVEEMTRAIGFYEANGFVRDDAQVRGSRCTRGYALVLA